MITTTSTSERPYAQSVGLEDIKGVLPHALTVTGTATVEVTSVFGWDLTTAKTIATGASVFNGWKLKITVSAGASATVNGAALSLTENVGYYTVGLGADVTIVVTEGD